MQATSYIGVVPKDLATGPFWPQFSRLLGLALEHGRGEYLLSDIRAGIEAGQMFATAAMTEGVVEFVATCTVVEYPRKRVLYMQLGAGRGGARAKGALTQAARSLACDWIETRCRASVARMLRLTVGFETGYQVGILEV